MPVATASGTTTGTGAPRANATIMTGQTEITAKAASIGRLGRQRKPITAPSSAPAPYAAVTTPNTAAES